MSETERNEWLKSKGEDQVKKILRDLLNEALESMNQERSFEIVKLDLSTPGEESFTVKFNVVACPEDNYIGFQGY